MLNLIRLESGTEFTQLKGFLGGKSSGHTCKVPVVNVKKSKRKCAFMLDCVPSTVNCSS